MKVDSNYDLETDIKDIGTEEEKFEKNHSLIAELKEKWNQKKTNVSFFILFSAVIVAVAFLILFLINSANILRALNEHILMDIVLIVMVFRIILLGLTAVYLYVSWMKQEQIIYDDAKFMFFLFFFFLTIGKTFDLFWSLTYFYYTEQITLTLLRVRFLIIATNLAPMLYFGVFMLLYSRRIKRKQSTDHAEIAKKRNIIMLLVINVMVLTSLLAPSQKVLTTLLPVMVIPSLALIVFVFYLAYKSRVLSEVHPLILMVGFFLYLVSNFLRAGLQVLILEVMIYTIITELIDVIVFLVIFVGFAKKISYANSREGI